MSSPGGAEFAATVAERTRAELAGFSRSELKVARALLAAYPAAGLETVAQFAARAHVSAPTVLRFTARLGFDSYPAFQKALIHEVDQQLSSPLRQIAEVSGTEERRRNATAVARHYIDVLSWSFDTLPEAEFDRAADLLSAPDMRIHLRGGRFSRVLAEYLASHLAMLRPAVRVIPPDELSQATTLLDFGQRDVLVVFDYRRYDPALADFAREAAARGARVVLFTDPWMSPAAQAAEVVLPSRVEAPSPFDSLVPAMAVVEAVVAAVAERRGDAVRSRLGEIEALSRSGDAGKSP
ncbi:MurR/RpiR family transcriptional regulator [Saccharopolyspora sp. WRP15-2]|uniref:MurR/RpiR family transcriptional regulator n=1 Tax=Saccharopolyspora oryzae TaxID=2997343 RepID=A0ABT4USP9_9PSEU|nr:MurR/RpiR family transcriptional regulator [Saccharopolyspora oryzae]MDA3624746.1 MurR/RpiR family transcriptional regulator [Saccharopolyspora oryzae]